VRTRARWRHLVRVRRASRRDRSPGPGPQPRPRGRPSIRPFVNPTPRRRRRCHGRLLILTP